MTVVKPLTEDETAALRGAVERMVPADADPDGWTAGVGDHVARLLAQTGEDLGPGLRMLDLEAGARRAGTGFASLDPGEQDALLIDLAAGRTRAAWPLPADRFVDRLALLCAEGFYGDPGTGGNRDAVSWSMVGYRVLPAGATWPATEPAAPTTPRDRIRPHYDAVVVGAGAGGGVAARVLTDAGLSVLLVERGRSLSTDDLPLDHLRSERNPSGLPTPTGPSPHGDPRVLLRGDERSRVDAPDPRWGANAFGVGGGTRVYGAQAWRFCAEDFRMASTYGVPAGSSLADWPIGYDDLEPWYARAEQELGVAGDPAGNRYAGHRSAGYPMPPMPLDPGARRLREAGERLGLGQAAVPLLINSEPWGGRPACVRCGACIGFACHAAAKNGSYNTLLPGALESGRCDLLTETQVERITVGAGGRADGVALVAEVDGRVERSRVTADRIVVAAGAIETARLLLNSTSEHEPAGLGNARDQVGRNLQAHTYAGALGLYDDVVQLSIGPGPSTATNDLRHGNPGVVGGGMLANDFVPTPLNVWDTLSRLGVIPRFGAASKDGMRRLWSRLQVLTGPVQEVPNPDARVELDPEVVDRFGIPVARLSGDVHPEDRRAAKLLAERAAAWLTESGARTVIPLDADARRPGPSTGQHQAGTCRMGNDPASSVTDPFGRVWGHPEVLLADGSVHVTNGGVNPVLTIMALALRDTSRFAERDGAR